MSKKMRAIATLISFLLITAVSFGQDPGGNPDGSAPAVPLEDYLLPILLVGGFIMVYIAIKNSQKRKKSIN